MPKVDDLIAMYRDLTKRTGILHEWQVKQLKLWPYALFDIKSHEILPDDRVRTITFNLHSDKPVDDHKKFAELESWVQHLLGGEWAIRIRDDATKAIVYRGERANFWLPPDDVEEFTFEQYEKEQQHGSNDGIER